MTIRDRLTTIAATVALTSMAWIVVGPQLLDRAESGPQELGAASVPPAAAPAPASAADGTAGGGLVIPVTGVTADQLVDTFSNARAGGARRHDAIDIPAPRGTEVVAAAPGTIEKLFLSDPGGITVYIRSTDGTRMHYYAHLERYARGLAEGQVVRAGQPIGQLGSTGNADPGAPHLHYAIMTLAPGEKWWQGTAINPYPLLTRAVSAHSGSGRAASLSTALP